MNSHWGLPSLSLWRGSSWDCLRTSITSCRDNPGYMPAHAAPPLYSFLGIHLPLVWGSGIPLNPGDGLARGAQIHTLLHAGRHKMKKKGFCPKELPLDLQFCKQEHTQQLNSKENITLLLFSKLLVRMLLSGLLLQYHDSVSLTGSQVSWCINTMICPAAWRTTGILSQAQESFKDKADAQIQDWVNLTVRGWIHGTTCR